MAWTKLTYACGHQGEEQMYGPGRERESKVAWIERNKVCPACYAEDRERIKAEAAQKNAEAGLPALTGTDPQKAWAEQIRAGAVSVIATATGMLASNPESLAERGITIEEVSSFAKRIMSQTSAKYFIDIIRGKDACMMAEYICKRAAEVKAEEIGKALIAGGAK